jgi:hypothetical protein
MLLLHCTAPRLDLAHAAALHCIEVACPQSNLGACPLLLLLLLLLAGHRQGGLQGFELLPATVAWRRATLLPPPPPLFPSVFTQRHPVPHPAACGPAAAAPHRPCPCYCLPATGSAASRACTSSWDPPPPLAPPAAAQWALRIIVQGCCPAMAGGFALLQHQGRGAAAPLLPCSYHACPCYCLPATGSAASRALSSLWHLRRSRLCGGEGRGRGKEGGRGELRCQMLMGRSGQDQNMREGGGVDIRARYTKVEA